jgi:hypothetical protein
MHFLLDVLSKAVKTVCVTLAETAIHGEVVCISTLIIPPLFPAKMAF